MHTPMIEGIEFGPHGGEIRGDFDLHHYQAVVICNDDTLVSIVYCDPTECTYAPRFQWDRSMERGCFYNHLETFEAWDKTEDEPQGYLTAQEVVSMIMKHGGIHHQTTMAELHANV